MILSGKCAGDFYNSVRIDAAEQLRLFNSFCKIKNIKSNTGPYTYPNLKQGGKVKKTLVFFWLIISNAAFCLELPEHVVYLHPKPDAVDIAHKTGIILRFDPVLSGQFSLNDFSITVTGENSGIHHGKMVLSDNNVLFQLNNAYQPGETVEVCIQCEKLGWTGPYTYHFSVNKWAPPQYAPQTVPSITSALSKKAINQMNTMNDVSVPPDFPVWNVEILEEGVAPGKIFVANYLGDPSYMMILDNDGTPSYYQRMEQKCLSFFGIQPSGELSIDNGEGFTVMDSNCTVKRNVECGFGYQTDFHDFLICPDGHTFMIAGDTREVDMSHVVLNGNSAANVYDTNIQECDENGNVIFVWRCSEYFDITEAVHENLKIDHIDFNHLNSIAIDYDGHIVISDRNLSEVTKINRQTGDIIWRLGGTHNEFDFVNDEFGISCQHDAQPVPGKPGHYTIFDNGIYHHPPFSRAVEFELDVENKTAKRIWEYRLPVSDGTISFFMGSVQRLPNGNTLINWAVPGLPKVTEVAPDGQVVYQADFAGDHCVYRSFRFDWDYISEKPNLIVESMPFHVDLIFNIFGDRTVKEYIVYCGRSMNDLEQIAVTSNTTCQLTSDDLENNKDYYFQVKAVYENGSLSDASNIEKVSVCFSKPGTNFVKNGDFSQGLEDFWEFLILPGFADGQIMIDSNEQLHFQIVQGGTDYKDLSVMQYGISLQKGLLYVFEFDGYSDSARNIEIQIMNNFLGLDYGQFGMIYLTAHKKHYRYKFEMKSTSDFNAILSINAGANDADVYIDNVSLTIEDHTDVAEQEDRNQPNDFRLNQNYPNPFNPSTQIAYYLPVSDHVSLKIYNLRGQEIETLVNAFQHAGQHEITWQPQGLSNGIFFYRLKAGGFTETRKLILQK